MSKVCVITGGAGGMGLATAKIMGKTHDLVIADVSAERLATASAELTGMGIRCESAVCDITDKQSVAELVKQATALGDVVAVVHTAGISPQMADPAPILRVNALGTMNIADAFYDIAGEGFVLVNVASMSGHMLPGAMIPTRAYKKALTDRPAFIKKILFRCRMIPNAFYRRGMAYALSKNFVMWYSRVTAAKFGEKGARILSVSPGSFDTAMGRLEEKSGSAEMLKTAALKRFGRPEEIAEVLAFCASDKASYLTGVDILCDGGTVAGRL